MPSIALVGPDGAGKTTLTRKLAASQVLRCRYLYMGIEISSSNLALPTSRLIARMRRRASLPEKPTAATAAARAPASVSRRSGILASALLLNRLAEEWFRQVVSWYLQWRGYVVLYDRHFALDFAPEVAAGDHETVHQRAHRWCVTHLYPKPDLVIFLDAPGEVLFARKGELDVDELERRRRAFLEQGARMRGFVAVDASQPLEEVYAQVEREVRRFCATRATSAPDTAPAPTGDAGTTA